MSKSNPIKEALSNWLSNIYHNWGATYVERGRNQDAINICSKSIRLNPNLMDTYVQRGIAYTQISEYELALNDFDMALEFDAHPVQQAEVFTRRGLANYYGGEVSEAICDYNMALHHAPTHSITYVYRGMAEFAQGNFEAAISDFNQAIRHDPQNHLAYRHRGDAQVRLGNLKQAIKDYWRYIELSTLHTTANTSEVRRLIDRLQRQLAVA